MKTKALLLRQLRIDPSVHRTISIVGAGGKTSLMKRLRDELISQGLKVIITTSTHIMYDDPVAFVRCGDVRDPGAGAKDRTGSGLHANKSGSIALSFSEKICETTGRLGYAVAGCISDDACPGVSKVSSPGAEMLDRLGELCDVLLIEADGARGMQVKVPAEWEPVIAARSDLVISVAGAGSIGKTIADAAYRPEELARFLGKSADDIIDSSDIIRIASSENGLRKSAGDREYRFYLNAVDAMTDPAESLLIMDKLRAQGICAACGSIRNADRMGAVILAAGLGTRFGGGKLESMVEGRPMFMRVLDELVEVFGYDGITFVASDGEPARAAAVAGAHVVINRHPQDGISSSMKLGLCANLHMGSCLFTVADQPYLSSTSIRSLVNGFKDSDRQLAAITTKTGDFSNPCIFGASYYGALYDISGDRGGKSIVRMHADDVYTCMPVSENELYDVDTVEDLEKIRND